MDRPGDEGHNKFLGFAAEGHRGVILAMRDDRLAAIVLAKTSSSRPEDNIRWGRLYLVEECDPTKWPRAIQEVAAIPDESGWTIVIPNESRC